MLQLINFFFSFVDVYNELTYSRDLNKSEIRIFFVVVLTTHYLIFIEKSWNIIKM